MLRDLVAMAAALIEEVRTDETDADDDVEAHFAGVRVRMRGIGLEEMTAFEAVLSVNHVADIDVSEGAEGIRARRMAIVAAKRAFVAAAFAEVVGLEDVDGTPIVVGNGKDGLTDEDLDVLDAADLIDELAAVARHWARLPSAKKKRCGSPQP